MKLTTTKVLAVLFTLFALFSCLYSAWSEKGNYIFYLLWVALCSFILFKLLKDKHIQSDDSNDMSQRISQDKKLPSDSYTKSDIIIAYILGALFLIFLIIMCNFYLRELFLGFLRSLLYEHAFE